MGPYKEEYIVTPITKTFEYGQHTVTLETGVIARQATAAVMASMDDTCVLVSVVGKKEAKEGQDFFPTYSKLPRKNICSR